MTIGMLEDIGGGRWRLRFTRDLAHPQEKVWRAITEPEHLAHWFPTTIEGERKPGADLRFSFSEQDLPPFKGEMIEFDPEAVIEKMASEAIRVVSLTVTEGGYNFNAVTGEFQADDPGVVADLAPGAVPRTSFGLVTEALARRRDRGDGRDSSQDRNAVNAPLSKAIS